MIDEGFGDGTRTLIPHRWESGIEPDIRRDAAIDVYAVENENEKAVGKNPGLKENGGGIPIEEI